MLTVHTNYHTITLKNPFQLIILCTKRNVMGTIRKGDFGSGHFGKYPSTGATIRKSREFSGVLYAGFLKSAHIYCKVIFIEFCLVKKVSFLLHFHGRASPQICHRS